MDTAKNTQNIHSLEHGNTQAQATAQPSRPLLPAFPDCSCFATHAHNISKSPIQLQNADVPLEIQYRLHSMLTNKFADIISKSTVDFGRTKLIEMDLPTTGPPVSLKPYTILLKYKSFVDNEINLLEDASCISKSLSNWASPICIIKKKPDPSKPHKLQLYICTDC